MMLSELSAILPGRVLLDEPMDRHTTFGIGGPADALVLPDGIDEIKTVVSYCRDNNIPCFVFGMGSNLLVRDKGIRGVVVKLGRCLNAVSFIGNHIEAEAGVSLGELAYQAAEHSLSGLEFAEGIPGTLGGAVVMNAGAYGSEISQFIESATVLTPDGQLQEYLKQDMNLGYRRSVFQELDAIVISARLCLKPGKREDILQQMREYAHARQAKQPLDMPSAGSTFRRPEGFYVGPLIEQMGLKGFSIGGAQISPKHAGFIVNRGNATARDVLDLIAHIQNLAQRHYNIDLNTEIKIIGEE